MAVTKHARLSKRDEFWIKVAECSGTNLKLISVEKYNVRPKVAYSTYYVTAVAKDPAVGGSLITFQTSSYIQGFDVKSLTCSFARPKPEPHEHCGYNRPTECGPIDRGRLPEWPADNAFDDKTRYYVVKKSELRKNDWIRLYLELAFLNANLSLPNVLTLSLFTLHGQVYAVNNNTAFFFCRLILSKLVIMKVAVETKENIVSPKERLNARNATFYIKYKFCPNKSRRPCKVDGCRATRERIAIIRRSLDKLSGLLTLSFHGLWKHTFL
ncbi:hypothetical protein Bca4012_022610 [Brassica carinata]